MKRRFWGWMVVFATLAVVAPAALGAPRIVGGTSISIDQTPWQVLVVYDSANESCGGILLDDRRVLTAAHCVFDDNGKPADQSEGLYIDAGLSNMADTNSGVLQARWVASYRVHPGYRCCDATAPDDVAVLTLEDPIDVTGPTARPISLPVEGAPEPAGATVVLSGYGQEDPNADPTGALNEVSDLVVTDPVDCAKADNAIRVCAVSPTGVSCHGDSGSALVQMTPTPTVIGVVSGGVEGCDRSYGTYFTYVAAPEILEFVKGSDSPPSAPQNSAAPSLAPDFASVAPTPGQAVTCAPGNWSNSASFTYDFVRDTGDVVQSGPSATYTFVAADVGHELLCRVTASSAGGTGRQASTATEAVAAPRLVVRITARPVLATAGVGQTVTFTTDATVAGATVPTATICITPVARVAAPQCKPYRLQALPATTKLHVVSKVRLKSAPIGRSPVVVSIRLQGGDGATTTVFLRARTVRKRAA